jgi:hypothetical protein
MYVEVVSSICRVLSHILCDIGCMLFGCRVCLWMFVVCCVLCVCMCVCVCVCVESLFVCGTKVFTDVG